VCWITTQKAYDDAGLTTRIGRFFHNIGACAPRLMTTRRSSLKRTPLSMSGETHPGRVFAARSATGLLERKIFGCAPAGIRGIPSIQEASAQHACTSGPKRSAFRALAGRLILTGMRSSP